MVSRWGLNRSKKDDVALSVAISDSLSVKKKLLSVVVRSWEEMPYTAVTVCSSVFSLENRSFEYIIFFLEMKR